MNQVLEFISKIPMNVKATMDIGMVFQPPLVDDTNLSSVSTVHAFLKCLLLQLCQNLKKTALCPYVKQVRFWVQIVIHRFSLPTLGHLKAMRDTKFIAEEQSHISQEVQVTWPLPSKDQRCLPEYPALERNTTPAKGHSLMETQQNDISQVTN